MTFLGFALAIVIGLSLGLLGGGGSILTVPVLHYVLGYNMNTGAVPMSLVIVGLTSAVGCAQHWRGGTVSPRTIVAFGPPAIVGALLGTQLARRVGDARLQLVVFGAVMIAASVTMYFGQSLWVPKAVTHPAAPTGAPKEGARRPLPAITILGAAVGALTGFVGVGGGFIYVPALVLLGGLPMKQAIGTSLSLILLSCLAGVIGYQGHAVFDWPAIAVFTALAFVGVVVGSRLVHQVRSRDLRRGFAVLVLVMGVLVLIRPR